MDKDGQQSPSFAPESEPERSGSMPVMRLTGTPFTPGEVVGGRYRIERIIAEGGMGIIVAAHHLELEERVAIKFLKEEFASKPEIVGRFAREAKAAARIKCEYTPTVFDVGISQERGPYIVMEHLEGEDLELVLETTGRLPFVRAAELIMQAGEAIAVAHANGIIHRDIKPANLFLVKGDQAIPVVKVLDFGVSKTALTGNVFGGAITLVKTQSLVGSPIYMSPEQIRGKQEVGYTSDVWSLGAVLYELVTGVTAFNGSSITELCASVLESEPEPVTDLVPEVPAGLAETIMRCLDKNAKRRFQSVAELVVALAPYAPKRARISVERAIAVSKSAGLLPASFAAPTTLAPPPQSSNHPIAIPGPAPTPRITEPAPPSDRPADAALPSRRPEQLDSEELRQSRKTRNATIIGALLIGAGVALGGVYLALRASTQRDAPAATAAIARSTEPTNAPASTEAAPPTGPTATTVTITLGAKPTEAKLYLDDTTLPSNPLRKTFHKDNQPHSIRAEAPGYVTRSVAVTFDSDKEIVLALDKTTGYRAVGPAARPPAVGAGAVPPPPAPVTSATASVPPAQATTAAPPPAKTIGEVDLPKTKKATVRPLDTSKPW